MSTTPDIFAQKEDAVLWKAKYLWQTATDPHAQAAAVEQIVTTLQNISDEIKRSAYISLIAKATKEAATAQRTVEQELRKKILKAEKEIDKLLLTPERTDKQDERIEALKLELEGWQKELANRQEPAEIKETELRKEVKAAISKKMSELQALKTKAQIDKVVRSAADAGLPEDFEGTSEEIYNALTFGVYEHKGVYYTRGGQKGDYEISNFTMAILYHVQTNDETAYRTISLRNRYGVEKTINMNTDDFVSLGGFKKVIARYGDFIFKGTESDLARLQEMLQKKEVATKYIDNMGWNARGRFYAWGNGLTPIKEDLDNFYPTDLHGMVTMAGVRYLIPACSQMYAEKDNEFTMEKQFIYVPQADPRKDWKWWTEIMIEVYGMRGITGILHYLCTVHRSAIFRNLRKFPLLNLFGPKGSGKSEMAISLMYLFGHDAQAISLEGESTPKSYMRKVAQKTDAYVWMDEYKNNQVKHIGSLKNIYDGTGYDRAKMTNDTQTKQTPVRASVILSGQEMPTAEPALFSRVIMEMFDGKDRNADKFQELKRAEQFGLSYLTADIIRYRGIIEQLFAETQPRTMKALAMEVNNNEVMDRMLLNVSVLLTTMRLLDGRIYLPFGYQSAKEHLLQNMMQQHYIMQGTDNVAKWWQVVEQLHVQKLIREHRDFELSDGNLYIKIQNVHPLYLKEMIAQRDANHLAKSTLEYYLELDKGIFLGKKRKRFKDGSNTEMHVFIYNKLGIDLIRGDDNEFTSPEQKAAALKVRYNEMGVYQDDEPNTQVTNTY